MKEQQIKFRVWNSEEKRYETKLIRLSKEGEFLSVFNGYDISMLQDIYIFEMGIKYCGENWWYEGDLVELGDGCIYLVAFMECKFVLQFCNDPVSDVLLADDEDYYTLSLWEADNTIKLVGNIHKEEKGDKT